MFFRDNFIAINNQWSISFNNNGILLIFVDNNDYIYETVLPFSKTTKILCHRYDFNDYTKILCTNKFYTLITTDCSFYIVISENDYIYLVCKKDNKDYFLMRTEENRPHFTYEATEFFSFNKSYYRLKWLSLKSFEKKYVYSK